jgi:hypothetical protein
MPNGDGGGLDFSGIANALLGELGAAIGAILQFLSDLVGALARVFTVIFGQQQFLQGFITSGLTEVFKGLTQIVEQVFKAVVLNALRHLRDLIEKIQQWVKKLKAWLDKLRRIQQQMHVKAFRDFINLIQRIRKVLVIFRIFHLKFATKLDNWLANLEGNLIRREVEYARKTNEIIAWINLIADPTGLFRPGALLGSITGTLGAFADALGAAGLKNIFPWLAAFTGPGVAVRPWSSVSAQFREERRSNTGDAAAAGRQFAQYRGLFAQDIGGGGP